MFVKELKLAVDDCGAVTQVSKGCVVAVVGSLLRLQLKHDKKLFFGGGGWGGLLKHVHIHTRVL